MPIFFNGELGKAILQYHKALYLNPVNSDAQHNLKFAQQQTNDVVHENIRQQLIKLICFWHGWQPNVRLILFFIAHSLFWIACALRLYKSSLNISRLKVYSLVSSILLGVSIITTITGLDRNVDGVVIAKESNPKQRERERRKWSDLFKRLYKSTSLRNGIPSC